MGNHGNKGRQPQAQADKLPAVAERWINASKESRRAEIEYWLSFIPSRLGDQADRPKFLHGAACKPNEKLFTFQYLPGVRIFLPPCKQALTLMASYSFG